jgi:hypothetical protein
VFKRLGTLLAALNSPFWRGVACLLSMLAATAGLAFTLTRWGLGAALWWTAVLVATLVGLVILLLLAGLFVRMLGKGKWTETLSGIASVLIILVVVGVAVWAVCWSPWLAPVVCPEAELGVVAPAGEHGRARCGACCKGLSCGGRCQPPTR